MCALDFEFPSAFPFRCKLEDITKGGYKGKELQPVNLRKQVIRVKSKAQSKS